MNGRTVVRVLLVLVVIAVQLGTGVTVYKECYAQCAVESGLIMPPTIGTPALV